MSQHPRPHEPAPCPRLNAWTLTRLPALNQAVLDGKEPCESLVRALREDVLPRLPADPGGCSAREAEQLTVLMGMWGSACVRHYVERGRVPAVDPSALFGQLDVHGQPFRDYLRRVAARTEAGHPGRDTYVSYFQWNPPSVRVRWAGRHWTSPGVFGDGQVRTFTGDPRERELLLFVKTAEALERAANELIEPLVRRYPHPAEAVRSMTAAAALLNALHRLFADFTRRPLARRVTPEFFSDTWRQFTNHWEPGDHPPSGASDVEFIARDFLLGLDVPDYASYVRRLYPALLPAGQERLGRLMGATPLPDLVLAHAGLSAADLRAAPRDRLMTLAASEPALAACYLLLAENVRVATAHLAFARRFVFDLSRARAAEGVRDTAVVSGRVGSTGIRESFMEELRGGRRNHPLTPFERLRRPALAALVDAPAPPRLGELVSVGA